MNLSSSTSSPKQIHVAAAVLFRDGKIFAAQRGPGRALEGLWEFPGGKIEAGETGQEALERELKEELLVTANIGEFVCRATHEYHFGTVTLDAFFCELRGEEPTLTEHTAFQWLEVSELSAVDWAPADIPVVESLLRLNERKLSRT